MTDHATNARQILTFAHGERYGNDHDRWHKADTMLKQYVETMRRLKKAGLLDSPVPSITLPAPEEAPAQSTTPTA